MSSVTISSDFGAPQNKVPHCLHCFCIYLLWNDGTGGEGNGNPLQYSCLENPVDGGALWAAVHRVTQGRTLLKWLGMYACIVGLDAMILVFWMLNIKPAFSLSSFTFIKRLLSSSSLSAIMVVSSAYPRLLRFLPAILIPACASSSPAFHMMYSAYKLNKQGDNIQPWHTPFPIWNQSVVPCPVLTVTSWSTYRFLKRQVRWSGIPISLRIFQFVVIHIIKGFGVVSKAEIDAFLELSCFFDDPMEASNLISGSSAFSKSSLNIWKFTVHVLLKPGLENFEHYFASVWDECNCVIVWTFFGIAFLWDWNENWSFPVLWPLLSFPDLLAYWAQHFHSINF